MHRHRVVAHTQNGVYTVALVRFLTDDQARSLRDQSKSPYKDTLGMAVWREQFNAQGMTTSRQGVT